MRALLDTKRYWLPLVGTSCSLIAVSYVGPVVGWLLIVLAFGLLFDGCTAWFARAGGTGGLHDHKQ
jgi:hypothetical protein